MSCLHNWWYWVSSSDKFCKHFGPRWGPPKRRAWSRSNLFDTQMLFQKEFFEKVDFEKNQQTTKKHENFPRRQRVKSEENIQTLVRMLYLCSLISFYTFRWKLDFPSLTAEGTAADLTFSSLCRLLSHLLICLLLYIQGIFCPSLEAEFRPHSQLKIATTSYEKQWPISEWYLNTCA